MKCQHLERKFYWIDWKDPGVQFNSWRKLVVSQWSLQKYLNIRNPSDSSLWLTSPGRIEDINHNWGFSAVRHVDDSNNSHVNHACLSSPPHQSSVLQTIQLWETAQEAQIRCYSRAAGREETGSAPGPGQQLGERGGGGGGGGREGLDYPSAGENWQVLSRL